MTKWIKPIISSVPGTARGLLCLPVSWTTAKRRQEGASTERWKNKMHAGQRIIRDRPVTSGLAYVQEGSTWSVSRGPWRTIATARRPSNC